MRWKLIATGAAGLLVAAGIALAGWGGRAAAKADLETEKGKWSYAIGVGMARNLNRSGVEVDMEVLAKGLKDGSSGEKHLAVAEDDLRQAMVAFESGLKEKQAAEVKTAAERNKYEGDAFLAQNAREQGVATLSSGLQYKVLRPGDGKRPTIDDTIECRYRSLRIDGREFDGSHAHGRTATIRVAKAISGWSEALKLMPVGSQWKLFVPSRLAYGAEGFRAKNGAGPSIGPNETLVFELELLAIEQRPGANKQIPVAKAPPQRED
jgi:FKBP-type peptidyl-prolyl cis-trans isomerase FklB